MPFLAARFKKKRKRKTSIAVFEKLLRPVREPESVT
jgi:hypothetical protein